MKDASFMLVSWNKTRLCQKMELHFISNLKMVYVVFDVIYTIYVIYTAIYLEHKFVRNNI